MDPDPALVRAEVARDVRWSEGGRGVQVELHGLRGLLGARFAAGAGGATGALAWTASVAAALQVSPRCARFERTGPAGSFLETVWVPDRLPGWVVELRPTGAWRPDTPLEGRLGLPDVGEAVSWDAAGGVVVVERSGDPAATTTLMVLGADLERGVLAGAPAREGDELVLPLHMFPAEPDGRVLLAVLDGPPDPVRLRSLSAVAAHRGRARVPARAFRMETGIDEVDECVAWAWTRLRDRLRAGPAGGTVAPVPEDSGELIRVALACGLDTVARAALAPVLGTADQVEGWVAWVDGLGPDPDFLALRPTLDPAALDAALRERLAEAARAAGDPGWAEELRATAPSTVRSMSLPTLGVKSAPGAEEAPRPTHDPEAAVLEWRARLASESPAFSASSLQRLGGLFDHLLGFRADAPAGRIHLTPTLPPHWTRMALRGLACGETRFELEYERTPTADGRVDRWTMRPVEGGVPSTLILRVPGSDSIATGVRIDGEAAELEVERQGTRHLLPVQLPLDGERVVEVTRPG